MSKVEEIIRNEHYFAHTNGSEKKELLSEHLDRCKKYYTRLSEKKGIASAAKRAIKRLVDDEKYQELIYEMFTDAIFLHDAGKINPAFQFKKMGNEFFSAGKPEYKKYKNATSNHSVHGAKIYVQTEIEKLKNMPCDTEFIEYFIYSFAYLISKHHGYLDDMTHFAAVLKNESLTYFEIDEENFEYVSECMKFHQSMDKVSFYILNKLLFSAITACDYYATYEYMNNKEAEIKVLDDIDECTKSYESGKIYKGIEQYKTNKGCFSDKINALRSDIFLEASSTARENSDKNIFYLEAPTGSGKTNISIRLALDLIKSNPEINNIFYIFPFNTLVEQTADTLKQYFGDRTVVVNSITQFFKTDEDNEKVFFDRQFYNYPIIVTSHVNLFSGFFGCGREQVFMLSKLCNSVVILDEIQSYKIKIWREMITFLSKYAEILNIKLVLMSATLPKLADMLSEKTEVISLIKNPDLYYQNEMFKNRVTVDYSLLDLGIIEPDELVEKVLEYKGRKILVEFITKEAARKFSTILKTKTDSVYELTGDDNIVFRKEVIKKIAESNEIIVVATQVIEAGIDIDMDIGFKNISILDSEEQFLGRINRSCKKKNCSAYFFKYTEPDKIYRGDRRTEYSLDDSEEMKKVLIDKTFNDYYNGVMNKLVDDTEKQNKNNIKNVYSKCLLGDYADIYKKMSLIDQTYQIYIGHILNINGAEIDGNTVWQKYCSLIEDGSMRYADKKVELAKLSEVMSYFTYNIYQGLDEGYFKYGYFYFENGEDYIVDGKFDRNVFTNAICGRFL